jgi:anoctamin-10
VFNIDSFRRLAVEVLLPYAFHAWMERKTTTTTTTEKSNDPVKDHHLLEYEQFDDYMEIMIQFGYVTLFASAYPLASLVMAGAVWMEIRSDMYKLTHLCQKPLAAERIHTIGIWKSILQVIIWSSCLTNCLLFGFTSDQMMQYMPHLYIRDRDGVTHMVHDKGWVAILIIFGLERLLIVVGLLLQVMIAPMSETLTIQIQRRKYILATLHDQQKKIN